MSSFKLSKLFAGDKLLWSLYGVFAAISIVEVFSASSSLGFHSNLYKPILGHVVIIILSVILMIFEVRVLSKRNMQLILALVYLVGTVLLLLLPVIGITINDANRWMRIGGINIQPSEIIKIGMISIGAGLMCRMNKNAPRNTNSTDPQEILKQMEFDKERRKLTYYYFFFMFVPILLILFQNFSTAIMLGVFTFMFAAVGKVHGKVLGRISLIVIIVGLISGTALLSLPEKSLKGFGRASVWRSRIESKFQRYENKTAADSAKFVITDDNLQEKHANIAIASGIGLGVGAGHSKERFILPQAYADYIYAIIIEEWGIPGLLLIPLLYLIFYFRMDYLARQTNYAYFKNMLYGIGILFVFQAFFNTAVATGMVVTGQTLPLISRGGSSYVMTSLSFGVAIAVSYIVEKKKRMDARAADSLSTEQEDHLDVEPTLELNNPDDISLEQIPSEGEAILKDEDDC